MPRVRRTPFTRRAARLGLNQPRPHQAGPRVAYFVDIFANYYDQELAEAQDPVAKALLDHLEQREQQLKGEAVDALKEFDRQKWRAWCGSLPSVVLAYV